ncbi:peptidase S9 [Kordiimonas sediminis]|uniref:Acyl-peptide hydrolase n=1 Tax=Kordiimonas sediminis TaxID=1735581 RepID=A0A919APH1_9PROT|nr:S9 family peptidase [Kordiimonas sediminis]GHF18646.1 peptidase S9 [Kordiimonas sediminis]
MVRKFGIVALAALMSSSVLYAESADWPYPQDVPVSEPVSVGLAGEVPADITRYLMARSVRSVQIAPMGGKVAYISNATGIPQVWVMNDDGTGETQLTFGNGVTFYRWHPEGTHILYGADNNGDEQEAYYLLAANGRSEKQVLEHSNAYRQFGAFSSDGTQIVYASTERNGRDFDIYVTDLESGDTRMVYEGTFGYYPVSWQPNGDNVIVSQTVGEDANNVFLLNVKSGEMKPLFKPEVASAYTDFTWYWRGTRFYFATNQDREYQALASYDMETGEMSFISEPDMDVENVRMCGGGRYLAWTTNEGGYDRLHLWDFKENRAASVPYLPDGVISISWVNMHRSWMTITVTGPSSPGDVYLWKVSEGEMRHLKAPVMAGLDRNTMVKPEAVTFKARDGVTVQGLLYLPKGVEKPPVVVDVHGGPTAQARPRWQPAAQYLVGKGIAVLDINVRGSTGFGKTYMRLDNQEKRLDSVRDLVDAVAWMREDGRVDADNAAVMGGSYGGYMVNAVMGLYPDVFKAGASFVGVSNWVRALETASPGLKASDLIEYGDIRDPKWQKFYAENSPINTAHKIKAPMFFEHGVNDPRDPVTETDDMVKTIRDNGYEVEYLRFPDEGHGIRKMSNRITHFRRLARFLETHLKAEN